LIQATSTASQNSNALYSITAGRTNQDGTNPATISIRRALIYFDVSGNVPAGATIDSVSLSLFFNKTSGVGTNVSVHRLLNDWGEGTSYQTGGQGATATQNDATWYYQKYNASSPSSSTVWNTPGGDFDPTVSATTYAGTGLGTGVDAYQLVYWRSSIMTSEVQAWLNNPSTNYGWLLQGDESTGQTAKQFLSRETGTSTTAPLLKVYYTYSSSKTATDLISNTITKFTTYPNPVTDNISINFSQKNQENIVIYNTCGAIVKNITATNELNATISLSDLTSGIYFIKIGSITSKVIKK
jgi:hypothetical protein